MLNRNPGMDRPNGFSLVVCISWAGSRRSHVGLAAGASRCYVRLALGPCISHLMKAGGMKQLETLDPYRLVSTDPMSPKYTEIKQQVVTKE